MERFINFYLLCVLHACFRALRQRQGDTGDTSRKFGWNWPPPAWQFWMRELGCVPFFLCLIMLSCSCNATLRLMVAVSVANLQVCYFQPQQPLWISGEEKNVFPVWITSLTPKSINIVINFPRLTFSMTLPGSKAPGDKGKQKWSYLSSDTQHC